MVQLTPAASGQQMGHSSYVPGAMYAYDVEHRSGLAKVSLHLANINGLSAFTKRMHSAGVCPVDTGACVSSATGGVISGYDMYGQYMKETVAAAGTTLAAFASVLSASPTDAKWTNKYGLPYKYRAAATPPDARVTFTPPVTLTGDERGTFVVNTPVTGPVEFEITYMADMNAMMGAAYADRLKAGTLNTIKLTVNATFSATGVAVVTIPGVQAGKATGVQVTFPDGYIARTTLGSGTLSHTMSPVWLSQYGDVMSQRAANGAIAVAFDAPEIANVYATVTGTIIAP